MAARRKSFVVIFNFVSILLTIALSILTLLAYLAPMIKPNGVWWIAFLGLGGQLLILANFIVLAYWIARLKWIAILPAIVLIMGVSFIGDFYQIRLTKHYEHEDVNDCVTLVSYNVKNFYHKKTSFEQISTLINQKKADIICFQEFGNVSARDSARIEAYYAKYEFKTINSDMAIFSKYPLHGTKIIHFPNTANNVLKADVVINDNTFVIYNMHLQTTEFNQVSGGGMMALVDGENSSKTIKSAGSAMKRNFIQRAEQADSLARMFAVEKFPIIVAGDVNDTPMSYTYQTIKGDLFYDAFRIAGNGYGYTYKNLMKLFRIDYVMCQKDRINIIAYQSPDVDYSDHNPVVVKFTFKQNIE